MIRNLLFEVRYFLGNTPWDTGVSPPELIQFLEDYPSGRALDLGCGTGTNALKIASYGWDVIGVDTSYLAIQRAREKAIGYTSKVDFQRLDVSRLKGIKGSFDLILDIGCFHSLSRVERERYIGRLAQLIHPQGTYLLYTWLGDGEDVESGPPTASEIQRSFSTTFDQIKEELGSERERVSAWYWMKPQAT